MSIKKGLLGFGLGFGATVLAYELLKAQNMSPEELTKRMIHATPSGGKIIGTWICTGEENNPNIYDKPFFRGGVTAEKNFERTQYTFIIDPKQGEILSIEQIFT